MLSPQPLLGIMQWCVAVVGVMAWGAQGFVAPAPIRWGGSANVRLFLVPAPQAALNIGAVLPQSLTISELPYRNSPNIVPRFVAKADNTIAWDGKCIDASGTETGDVVRIDHCNGRPNQLWNWLPSGTIQLKGTDKCLFAKDGLSDGVPIKLRDCEHEPRESWHFEGDEKQELHTFGVARPTPTAVPLQQTSSSLRPVRIALISLIGVVALGTLRFSILQQHMARAPALSQDSAMLNVDQGSTALIEPSAICVRTGLKMNVNGAMPAVMAIDPVVSQDTPEDIHASDEFTLGDETWTRDDREAEAKAKKTGVKMAQPRRYRTSDWLQNLRSIPSSRVLRSILGPVVANLCWAALVVIARHMFGWPARSFANFHGLIGSALGLLLVFRTNSAYQRFWEGSKLWEALLGDSRALARLTRLYSDQVTNSKVNRVANLICAFSITLAKRLGAAITSDDKHLLTQEDKRQLKDDSNRPLTISHILSTELVSIPDQTSEDGQILFSNRERLIMLGFVDKMTKYQGACERLVQTPVPLNYARHTSRFLSLWTLTLPLVLVADVGAGIIPIMGFVSWALYGIHEIGLMIEDPFCRSLNLDLLVRTICADVQRTTSRPDTQKSLEADGSAHEDSVAPNEDQGGAISTFFSAVSEDTGDVVPAMMATSPVDELEDGHKASSANDEFTLEVDTCPQCANGEEETLAKMEKVKKVKPYILQPQIQPQRYRSSDWWQLLRSTRSSEVLRSIRGPVGTNVFWAIGVASVHHIFGRPARSFASIHGLIGSALGLLLVFRTNSAYQRFWEGSKLWESLLGESRALARLAMLYRKELTIRKVKRVANLICAFSMSLAKHLGASITRDYKDLLTEDDNLHLKGDSNRPLTISNMLSMELKSIPDQQNDDQILFSNRERMTMLGIVDKMTKCQGACERLVQTPVPLNYARHTSRFLSLWTLTLPLVLVADVGVGIIPIMGLVSWALFGIQEIGLMIEDPFSQTLNLDIRTRTICADVQKTALGPENQNQLLEASSTQHMKEASPFLAEYKY